MRTQTKDIQTHLTPEKALDILVEGNRRFVSNLRVNRNLLQQVNETAGLYFSNKLKWRNAGFLFKYF